MVARHIYHGVQQRLSDLAFENYRIARCVAASSYREEDS